MNNPYMQQLQLHIKSREDHNKPFIITIGVKWKCNMLVELVDNLGHVDTFTTSTFLFCFVFYLKKKNQIIYNWDKIIFLNLFT